MKAHRPVMRLAFHVADRQDARVAYQRLTARYGEVAFEEADAAIALGGDGCMLEALHKVMDLKLDTPVFGMNSTYGPPNPANLFFLPKTLLMKHPPPPSSSSVKFTGTSPPPMLKKTVVGSDCVNPSVAR